MLNDPNALNRRNNITTLGNCLRLEKKITFIKANSDVVRASFLYSVINDASLSDSPR